MEVGLSTASFFPDLLTEDAIDAIGRMGVKTAEIFLGSFSEYKEDFCKILKERLDANQIRAYSVHSLSTQYEPQLFSATERQRKDALDIFLRVLKCARIVGAEVFVFHGPAVRKNTQVNLDFSWIGPIVDELAEYAGDFGIKFSWENVYWCWYSFPEFAPRLLEHTRSDNLFFTLDIKQAMKSSLDPFDYLEKMGNRIVNIHACDYNSNGELYLPGKGNFDFPRLRKELALGNYNGPVIMEVYRNNYRDQQHMMKGINYLDRIFCSSSL